jgi:hypothetical protein
MAGQASKVSPGATGRPPLALFDPAPHGANAAHWRINGFRASILVWTVEEWEQLTERPADAQFYPCGIWCALRIE